MYSYTNDLGQVVITDIFGTVQFIDAAPSGMLAPVRCSYCGKTYDLTDVSSKARFADCDVFDTPCCGKTADTREYGSMPSFKRL